MRSCERSWPKSKGAFSLLGWALVQQIRDCRNACRAVRGAIYDLTEKFIGSLFVWRFVIQRGFFLLVKIGLPF